MINGSSIQAIILIEPPQRLQIANDYGLHDNAGNVAEWLDSCQQWSDSDKTHCQSAGSHLDAAQKLTPDYTEKVAADKGSKAIGFRLVLEL